jgi:PAS domain S-box-containing protein
VIQYVNPAFERITGYRRQEAIGQTPRLVKSGVHDGVFYENLWTPSGCGKHLDGPDHEQANGWPLIQEDAS